MKKEESIAVFLKEGETAFFWTKRTIYILFFVDKIYRFFLFILVYS